MKTVITSRKPKNKLVSALIGICISALMIAAILDLSGCGTTSTVVTPGTPGSTNAQGVVTPPTPPTTNTVKIPISASPILGTNGILTAILDTGITVAIVTEGQSVIQRSPQHAAAIQADLKLVADVLSGATSTADAQAAVAGLKLQSSEVQAFLPMIVALLNWGDQQAMSWGASSGYFVDVRNAFLAGLTQLAALTPVTVAPAANTVRVIVTPEAAPAVKPDANK